MCMGYTRLSVNINAETRAALEELANRDESSFTEEVRRAIGVYKFIYDKVQEGKRMQLVDDDEIITLQLIG